MSSIRSALDEYAKEDLSRVQLDRMAADVVELYRFIAAAEAEALRRVAEIEGEDYCQDNGYVSAASWLSHQTGQAPGVARNKVSVARQLGDMALTSEAFSQGDLTYDRVRMLARSHTSHPEVFQRDEEVLVEAARDLSARQLRNVLDYWSQNLDQEAALEEANLKYHRRRLSISKTFEGMVRLDGDLDPEGGEVVLTALGALTAPSAKAGDDDRTPGQRRADALVEICRDSLDHGDAPVNGGEKPHITVQVDLEYLETKAGQRCQMDATGVIHPETALRLACDASISRVITKGQSLPLDVGRSTRTVTPAQRRALVVRDGGCVAEGCDRPSRWCDAHHLQHWVNHLGPTDLDNLALLCRRHHRMVHEGRVGLRLRAPPRQQAV